MKEDMYTYSNITKQPRRFVAIASFLILLLFQNTGVLQAADYYVSNSGSDLNNGLTPATAWASLSKVNQFMGNFQPGDQILFERGGIFSGTLTINRSGSAGSPIRFAAYGTGNLPILTGEKSITGWTALGGNVYTAPCTNCPTRVENVLVNGLSQQIGRFPNADAANAGYLIIDSHSGQNQLTDSDLASTPNWTGGEVGIRTRRWLLDRLPISNHTGTTLSLGQNATYDISDNYGYFIQNHPATLDQQGEWAYNAASSTLSLYLSQNPNTQSIAVSFEATLMEIQANYITLDGLRLQNANEDLLRAFFSDNLTVTNCEFFQAGRNAVAIEYSDNPVFEYNLIDRTNNNGLRIYICPNALARYNEIKRTGLRAGMSQNGELQRIGVSFNGEGSLFAFNTVDSTGHTGIRFDGSYVSIEDNLVSYVCLVTDDGAGIYTWKGGGPPDVERVVSRNIVLYAVGVPEGTNNADETNAEGIYIDDRSDNVEVTFNTVAHGTKNGIYVHNSSNVVVENNLLFDNRTQLYIKQDDIAPGYDVRNLSVQNNTLIAAKTEQLIAEFITQNNDIPSFGTFNNNRYCHPFAPYDGISLYYDLNGTYVYDDRLNFAQWQQYSGMEAQSAASPVFYPGEYEVQSFLSPNAVSDSGFDQGIADWYCFGDQNNCAYTWDANSPIQGGAFRLSFSPFVGGSRNHGYYAIGAINGGDNYLLSYDLVGQTTNANMHVHLRQDGGTYQDMLPRVQTGIESTTKRYQILWQPDYSYGNSRIEFEIQEDDAPIWVDNVSFRKVSINPLGPTDFFQFAYNASSSPATVSVIRDAVDATGQAFAAGTSITLPAYGSAVLFKDPDGTGVFPIELLEFYGTATRQGNELTWITATEVNGDRFELERKSETGTFAKIGEVDAIGNSAISQSYTFTDPAALSGRQYYRLRMVDLDGSFSYSNIIEIENDFSLGNDSGSSAYQVQAYPNPFENQLTCIIQAETPGTAQLSLMNLLGTTLDQRALTLQAGNNQIDWTFQRSLSAGIYYLVLEAQGQRYIKRLAKL